MVAFRRLAMLILLGTVLAACGTAPASESAYTVVATPAIAGGAAIPAPASPDAVILSVQGGSSENINFSFETLEALGIVEYTVKDPFLKKETTYQGVLVSELLKAVGAPESATMIAATALNDYTVEIPIADVKQYPVILATRRDGQRMEISDKGPLEVVFPYHAFDIASEVRDSMWIWQLRSLEIR